MNARVATRRQFLAGGAAATVATLITPKLVSAAAPAGLPVVSRMDSTSLAKALDRWKASAAWKRLVGDARFRQQYRVDSSSNSIGLNWRRSGLVVLSVIVTPWGPKARSTPQRPQGHAAAIALQSDLLDWAILSGIEFIPGAAAPGWVPGTVRRVDLFPQPTDSGPPVRDVRKAKQLNSAECSQPPEAIEASITSTYLQNASLGSAVQTRESALLLTREIMTRAFGLHPGFAPETTWRWLVGSAPDHARLIVCLAR